MANSRKSKRRKTKSRLPIWTLPLVLISLGIFGFVWIKTRPRRAEVRHRTRRPTSQPAAPHAQPSVPIGEIVQRFRLALEHAAGDNIWIREDPTSPSVAFSASLTPGAFNAAEQAMLHTAHAQGLRIARLSGLGQLGGMRQDRFTAYSGNSPACTWTLREVPRIARVAIIVDDLGQNLNAARELLGLREPVTFSVMPHLRYSRWTADAAHRAGIEVMLHLPMQPIVDSAPDVSPQELKVGMGSPEVDKIIQSGLATVPYAAGVNNHMGSRATADGRLMGEVMEELAGRHLYYIDSRTIPDSVALAAARRSGVPAFYRSVFLDDTRSVPYTLAQLRKVCRVARRQGAALAIGHPYPTTITALDKFLPELERKDIQLVPASKLVRQAEAARLSPSTRDYNNRGRGGVRPVAPCVQWNVAAPPRLHISLTLALACEKIRAEK